MPYRNSRRFRVYPTQILILVPFCAHLTACGKDSLHHEKSSRVEERLPAGWKTYRSDRFGYELSYPPSLDFEMRLDMGELREPSSGTTVFRTEVWPPFECMHERGESPVVPMQKMALERAKAYCDAAGPGGITYCSDPVTVKPFSSRSGARGVEMVLTFVRERSETSWLHPMKKTIEGNRGPVYAFDLSNERMTRILYVHPQQFEVDEMSRLLEVRPKALDAEEARVREILSTVKAFKVDPGPKPICIQDLRLGGGTGAFARPSR